jgi:hypothetical protein
MDPQPEFERSHVWIWIAAVAGLVIIVGGGLWFWLADKEDPRPQVEVTADVEAGGDVTGDQTAQSPEPPGPEPTLAGDIHERSERWTEIIDSLDEWPLEPDEARCRIAEEDLLALVRGNRPAAMEDDASGLANRDSLSALVIDLVRRPPTVSGELSDAEAFRSNVFHFYRVLGKKRSLGLIELYRSRREAAEPLAAASYRWLMSRQACGSGVEREITLEALADYASYLLQTFGGRSYLMRRLPREEAIITLYAVLIVDRAREAGISPHGTDPRPAIERCRALVEAQPLAYREEYLELLDRVASHYP